MGVSNCGTPLCTSFSDSSDGPIVVSTPSDLIKHPPDTDATLIDQLANLFVERTQTAQAAARSPLRSRVRPVGNEAAPVTQFSEAPLDYFEEEMRRLAMATRMPASGMLERSNQSPKAILFPNENRYPDMLPTDKDLITVGKNYINASRMNSETIVTQGPCENTLTIFWALLHQESIKNLICLTPHEEGGREKTYPYWDPSLHDKSLTVATEGSLLCQGTVEGVRLEVTLIRAAELVIDRSEDGQYLLCREFKITRGEKSHSVVHWHYLGWNDHTGVCNPEKLLKLLTLTRGDLACVHCSAGVGRAGTFTALKELLSQTAPTNIDVRQVISGLRERRPGSVLYASQLQLIYRVLNRIILEAVILH